MDKAGTRNRISEMGPDMVELDRYIFNMKF